MESNARLVEWDDGTMSLVIGDQHYEVFQEDQESTLVFQNAKKLDLLKGQVNDKLIVKPQFRKSVYSNGVN